MAVTVTDDFTQITSMDDANNQDSDGSVFGNTGSVDTTLKVEGTAANYYQAKGTGVGSAGRYSLAADIANSHLYIWFRNLDNFETEANGGMRFRVVASGSQISDLDNYREWIVGGQDTRRTVIDGFVICAVDTTRAYDGASSGTAPTLTNVGAIGAGGNAASASGQNTMFVDEMKEGSKIIIGGGGSTTQGNSSEVFADDYTNARGVFRDIGGVNTILAGIDIGNTATASSYFFDVGETWLFEQMNVADDLYTITLVGNSTGTNSIVFGNKNGTGIDATGTGGNTFVAGGDRPFNFVVTDADVDEAGFYGCTFINANDDAGTFNATIDDAEIIGCQFAKMGQITLNTGSTGVQFTRNGVNDSLTAATGVEEAAINLGTTKPATNNFRFITINGASRYGLRIEGSSTTGDTWTFNDITIDNSGVADLLVDYPAQTGGNKVTVNLVDSAFSSGSPAVQVAVTGGIALADVVVNNAVNVTVNVVDRVGAPIFGSRVIVEAAGSPGTLPDGESVTITRSGTTATVTHTAHGLASGDKVAIRNANEGPYNGVKIISVTGTNTYTYEVSSPLPTTPATGSITSTAVILEGTTDSSGQITASLNYTSDQPITGVVRNGPGSPIYKDSPITGTIGSAGFETTITTVSDEA